MAALGAASAMIHGSELKAGGNISISQLTGPALEDGPFKILRERTALGALHDSAERPDPPKCHPQTREAIQDQIDQWARDRSVNAKPILWLTGAAGAGKSAIAQTLIERWKDGKLIVPNFFCWRTGPKRNQKTHLIPTLSFQLTRCSPEVSEKIKEVLKDDCIFERNLKSQVEELIIRPLADTLAQGQLVVIVIDGLDEVCVDLPPRGGFPGQNYEDQQRELLEVMAFACQKLPLLRVFIASRPERQIRTSFAESPLADSSVSLSLVNAFNVNADIILYLKCRFAEIRQRHPGIDPSWPSDEQINLLVKKSSGQFIYPSTVIKYISRGRQFPVKSLKDVLALQTASKNRKENPLAELDALYTLVLQSVVPESWAIVRLVLGLVCHNSIRMKLPSFRWFRFEPGLTHRYLEYFLILDGGELSFHMTDLHSLLSIPDPNQRQHESREIHSLHATLSEYLTDQTRSGDLSIEERDVYAQFSVLLIKHIQSVGHVSWGHNIPESDQRDLYELLLSSISLSSLSMELMETLWDFLKGHIGEYNSNDVLPSMIVSHAAKYWFVFCGDERSSARCYREREVQMLDYLLDCNNPLFEPSQDHREVIDRRLKEFLAEYDPEHPIAVQYIRDKRSTPTKEKNSPPAAESENRSGLFDRWLWWGE